MHRDNIIPFDEATFGTPTPANARAGFSGFGTDLEKICGAPIRLGRELTSHTAHAERKGDFEAVERCLRAKDRIHRLKRSCQAADPAFE